MSAMVRNSIHRLKLGKHKSTNAVPYNKGKKNFKNVLPLMLKRNYYAISQFLLKEL